jgi:hypothetical protein
MTGLIVCAEYNTQIHLSDIAAMVMAHVELIAINYTMFVNPFMTNVVMIIQIQTWWSEKIASIDPAQRNSDPLHAYISVVNE